MSNLEIIISIGVLLSSVLLYCVSGKSNNGGPPFN